MSKHYEDWADWAGDHPQQAEEDLRKQREKEAARAEARWQEHMNIVRNSTIQDRDGADSAALYAKERREREAETAEDIEAFKAMQPIRIVDSALYERLEAAQEVCQHTEVYETGHCADCGYEVEGFEPTDAQIFAHYGQTKETAA